MQPLFFVCSSKALPQPLKHQIHVRHWNKNLLAASSNCSCFLHRYKLKIFLGVRPENSSCNSTAQPPRESQLTSPSPDRDMAQSCWQAPSPSFHPLHHLAFWKFPKLLICGMLNKTNWDCPETAWGFRSSADAIVHFAEGDHDQAELLAQLLQTQPRRTSIYTSSANEEIVQAQVYTSHMTGALSKHPFLMSYSTSCPQLSLLLL